MPKKCGKFMADWRDSSPMAQTPATYGSQQRNQFCGPGYFNTDFTIMKNTAIPAIHAGSVSIISGIRWHRFWFAQRCGLKRFC
jgi:hypothetical protein